MEYRLPTLNDPLSMCVINQNFFKAHFQNMNTWFGYEILFIFKLIEFREK